MDFKENKLKGSTVRVHCIKCQGETKHLVIQDVEASGSECIGTWEDGNLELHHDFIDWDDSYQIVQCQGCETISFRHLHWFSEDGNPEFREEGTTERLYPQRSKRTMATAEFLNVPMELRRIYRETIDAFNYELLTLCAGGLRTLVEGICAHHGVKDGQVEKKIKDGIVKLERKTNLEGKIAGLHEKGILTKPQSDQLHEHRYLGNEALHELLQPSPTELSLAIDIIEHTLKSLYEMPKKRKRLKELKTKRIGDT